MTVVSTHSRPKAAGGIEDKYEALDLVSTHSRPKAAGVSSDEKRLSDSVSTHSRPKAAGTLARPCRFKRSCFNTQPPEGGWMPICSAMSSINRFNTQPPEGGWLLQVQLHSFTKRFQHTAARRRLVHFFKRFRNGFLFQHTAARRRLASFGLCFTVQTTVSTHSRPKAAGCFKCNYIHSRKGFNTQPPEGGWGSSPMVVQTSIVSTHSRPKAAGNPYEQSRYARRISTHSRPKAAGRAVKSRSTKDTSFNTQPPEGGWPNKSALTRYHL